MTPFWLIWVEEFRVANILMSCNSNQTLWLVVKLVCPQVDGYFLYYLMLSFLGADCLLTLFHDNCQVNTGHFSERQDWFSHSFYIYCRTQEAVIEKPLLFVLSLWPFTFASKQKHISTNYAITTLDGNYFANALFIYFCFGGRHDCLGFPSTIA